jgi:hypothetical protein
MTSVLGDRKRGAYDPNLAERISKEADLLPESTPTPDKEHMLNPYLYYLIGTSGRAISKEQMFNGISWKDAHQALHESHYSMCTVADFMQHLFDVRDALASKKDLQYANKEIVPQPEVISRFLYLTYSHCTHHCDIWLDARFTQINKLESMLETSHTFAPENTSILVPKQHYIIKMPKKSCFNYELSLENCGFPFRGSSRKQDPQKNIHYDRPIEEGTVVTYINGQAGTLLSISRPEEIMTTRGVLACIDTTHDEAIR